MSTLAVVSYCSVDEADEYFSQRLNSESWSDADENAKKRALATATRLIRDYTAFFDEEGAPFSPDPDDPPDEVKAATAEQALYLLNLGFDPTQPKKVNILGIRTTEGTTFDKDMTAEIICEPAIRLLENIGAQLLGPAAGSGISVSWLIK